jgi:uracil-DNA glycosylase
MISKDNFKELMDISWLEHLWPVLSSKEMQDTFDNLRKEKSKGYTILPDYKDTFNAFKYTPWDNVKVVILGRGPHIQKYQDHGLALSTQSNTCSEILQHTIDEVEIDVYNGFDLQRSATYDLTPWASQGVLLLNIALTTRLGWHGSHKDLWEHFTIYVLKELSIWKTGVVYMLWGPEIQKFKPFINEKTNHIIEVDKYNPLGSKCFSTTNKILNEINGEVITW